MRIELDKLEGKSGSFAHTYEPEELLLADEYARLTAPPQISGRIKRSDNRVRLRGAITARAEVYCDRCVKAVAVSVETNFDVTYVPAADYHAVEVAELQAEDLDQSVFDGEEIDIDELVREQVLLALPTRALCSEDCKGLCPACGADRNAQSCSCEDKQIDPRWAALKNLRS